jgi:drug/metabolite transporter (DMT)-like permease
MPLIWAGIAALFYGLADYSGSRASRFANSASITFFGQATAFAGIGVYLVIVRTPVMPVESWLWTTGGGFGGAIALVAFYKAMSLGSMTVIAPITAVIGLSVPVFAGSAFRRTSQRFCMDGYIAGHCCRGTCCRCAWQT